MNCKNAIILISASLDGELSEREIVALDRHLLSCSACTLEKAKLASVSSAMQVWEDIEPSDWLAQSFSYKLCELQMEPQVAKKSWANWMTGVATAGLVTAALAILLVFHGHNMPITNSDVPISPKQVAAVPPIQTPTVQKTSNESVKVAISKFIDAIPNRTMTTKRIATVKKRSFYIASELRTRRHRPYKPSAGSRLDFHPRGTIEVASRGWTAGREKAEQEYARKLIIDKLLKTAKTPEGDAAAVVAGNLSGAGVEMDETLERVRGALRKAADVLAEPPVSTENLTDSNGGNTL